MKKHRILRELILAIISYVVIKVDSNQKTKEN